MLLKTCFRTHFSLLKIVFYVLLLCCVNQALPHPKGHAKSNQSKNFKEGKHYLKLSNAVQQNRLVSAFKEKDPKKPQVLSFFNYACYGCSVLSTALEHWVKQKGQRVAYYQIPVIFHPSWRTLATAFYIVDETKQLKTLHPKLFKAIHEKHINLFTPKKLKKYLVKQGMQTKEIDHYLESFLIRQRVDYAEQLQNAYQVKISPAVIVNTPSGSYMTNFYLVSDEEKLLAVLDHLIKL